MCYLCLLLHLGAPLRVPWTPAHQAWTHALLAFAAWLSWGLGKARGPHRPKANLSSPWPSPWASGAGTSRLCRPLLVAHGSARPTVLPDPPSDPSILPCPCRANLVASTRIGAETQLPSSSGNLSSQSPYPGAPHLHSWWPGCSLYMPHLLFPPSLLNVAPNSSLDPGMAPLWLPQAAGPLPNSSLLPHLSPPEPTVPWARVPQCGRCSPGLAGSCIPRAAQCDFPSRPHPMALVWAGLTLPRGSLRSPCIPLPG